MPLISGVVFLDKPQGWTSRQAVNAMIHLFSSPGKKRIRAGHAGTLDPLATGMLPVLFGEATRFAASGLDADKVYDACIDLSMQTDTLDADGSVIARFNGSVGLRALQHSLARFCGCIHQIPPAYSALHIRGRRACDMARAGEKVELAARPVEIHELRLLDFSFPLVSLRVRSSKGTYIRSLARDIGSSLGMGGCITSLRRLSTGGWPETAMVTMADVMEKPEACVLPLRAWLRDFQSISLAEVDARRFVQGQRIRMEGFTAGVVSVFRDDTLLGTGMLKPGMQCMVLHPLRTLPSARRRLLQ